MVIVTAVLLANNPSHALFLAENLMTICDGYLTTLVDDNRVYCSLLCDDPEVQGDNIKSIMVNRILEEITIRDKFEEKLASLGCPFTFVEDSDTDDKLTLEDMKACDGANELLTRIYDLESLRTLLSHHKETHKYAEAIDALVPYVKKAIFSKCG